jgi:ubiquinone/menaquinone biosynthesis C-methylase UbiE
MNMRVLAAGVLLTGMLQAQVAQQANTNYQTEQDRKKIAAGLGDPHRDEMQKPGLLIHDMGLQPGMTVADVGTGVGYMLPFLSKRVGADGKVIAEDIFDDFLAAAKQRAAESNSQNISFVKGTETDPMLPEGKVDMVLALDVYHHFNYPEKMLAAMHKSLRDGGKLVIVEYYKRPTAMPEGRAMTHIRLDILDVIKEIEANHFHLVEEKELNRDVQYMLILEKN